MWNVTYTNLKLNKRLRLMEHKGHLARIAAAKTMINDSQPEFFKKRPVSVRPNHELKRKIDLENKLMYNKILKLSIQPSRYNITLNKPIHFFPSFNSTKYNKLRKEKDIEIENKKLIKRFNTAKSSLNITRLEERERRQRERRVTEEREIMREENKEEYRSLGRIANEYNNSLNNNNNGINRNLFNNNYNNNNTTNRKHNNNGKIGIYLIKNIKNYI